MILGTALAILVVGVVVCLTTLEERLSFYVTGLSMGFALGVAWCRL